MKKSVQPHIKKWWFLIVLIILAMLAVLFVTLGGPEKVRKAYWSNKVHTAFNRENKNLGDPLKTLGFTNIEGGQTKCEHFAKYGYSGNPLDCTVTTQSYMVFGDDAAKTKATTEAVKLSQSLKQNGWQHGNFEVSQWFKEVLSGTDWNGDAYQYKYDEKAKMFCVLDFFVAYSNPKPPAVQARFSCTMPETHPPGIS